MRFHGSIADGFRIERPVNAIQKQRVGPRLGAERPGAFDGRFGDLVFRDVVHPFPRPPGHGPAGIVVDGRCLALDIEALDERARTHRVLVQAQVVITARRRIEDLLLARLAGLFGPQPLAAPQQDDRRHRRDHDQP